MNQQHTQEATDAVALHDTGSTYTVATADGAEVLDALQTSPAILLHMAIQNKSPMDIIERLVALDERRQASLARNAFHAAKAAFKAEDIHVTKDKENKQYKSMYTTIGNLVGTVSPYLGKHGLSAEWDVDQFDDGRIKVTCRLSHAMGHSESTSLIVPPDAAGAKNPIQQIKSAITYAKVVTFESITGIASSEANLDDDGNNAGGMAIAMASEKILDGLLAKLEAAKTDADCLALWRIGRDSLEATQNIEGTNEFRQRVEQRRAALKVSA